MGPDPDDAMAIRMGEAAKDGPPDELVEPGARNHPNDCECPTCTSSLKEGWDFSKFMDRILEEGRRPAALRVTNDSPHRIRAAQYQERPMGRTRIGVSR
jgi:rubredoxin